MLSAPSAVACAEREPPGGAVNGLGRTQGPPGVVASGPAPRGAKTLQASAYFATRRSVFRSPPPPTMIGGCGCRSGCGELIVSASWKCLPSKRPVLDAPHLAHDLQGFLEPLETLGQRRERYAEGAVLAFVPGCSDAERGPPAGEHVERRQDLGEQAWVAGPHCHRLRRSPPRVVAPRARSGEPAGRRHLAGKTGHVPCPPGNLDPATAPRADPGRALRDGLL